MTWLLIIHAFFPPSLSIAQGGAFATEQECPAAGEMAAKEFPGRIRFVCVATSAHE